MAGVASRELELLTTPQIRVQLVESGSVTPEEVDQHLANLAAGRVDVTTSPMISAWGRVTSSTD